MVTRRHAVFAVLCFLAGPAPAAESAVWTAALAKERYLLAQMSVSVRGWIRVEGRRQADGSATEEAASAAVRERYPGLSPRDVGTLAFVVLMVAARDLDTRLRDLDDPAAAGELGARRARLADLLAAMAGRTPDLTSRALRALR